MQLQLTGMSAQQGVIFPSEPLLIVDRQWRKRKASQADEPSFSVLSGKRDITISVFGRRASDTSARPTSLHPQEPPARPEQSRNQTFQFVDSRRPPPRPTKRQLGERKTKKRRKSTESAGEQTAVSLSDKSPAHEQTTPAMSISAIVPNSSTTFYAYTGDHIRPEAQELLHYCKL
jgi:hypothetical protein